MVTGCLCRPSSSLRFGVERTCSAGWSHLGRFALSIASCSLVATAGTRWPILRDLDCLARAHTSAGVLSRSESLRLGGQVNAWRIPETAIHCHGVEYPASTRRKVSFMPTYQFPSGFVWGVAAASAQIEVAPRVKAARVNRSGTGSHPYLARSKAATRRKWPAIIITASRPTST